MAAITRTVTGSLAATDDAVTVQCPGSGSVAVVLTGTWVATITPEVSVDGTTWIATKLLNKTNDTVAATVTANGSYLILHTEGVVRARVRASAYTSGTVTVTIVASDGPGNSIVSLAPQGTQTVDTEMPAAAALADATANPTTTIVGTVLEVWNGTNLDRVRGNIEGTLLASAQRTATTTTSAQTNYNHCGLHLLLDVTAASGTGGLQVVIRGRSAGGNTYELHLRPTAVTTIRRSGLELYPGASTAAPGGNDAVEVRVAGALPRSWDVAVVHGDGSNYTYALYYSLIV